MSDWDWLPWLLLGAVLAFVFLGARPAQAPLYYPPPHRALPRNVDTNVYTKVGTNVYTNDESWEIVTDRQGRVVGVKGKRRAEQTKE